jgi:hypothetical protein
MALGNGKKVSPILPTPFLTVNTVNQSQVSLMDQRSGLQRVIGTFLTHIPTSQSAQFIIDQWDQL